MFVCTLGDLLLDVIVRLREPLAPGADATSSTRLVPGGQAANVAAWVVALGARARLICKRGDDGAARLSAEGLARRGVELAGPVVAAPGGVVVSLVEPNGDRTMASDRGVSPSLEANELREGWLEGADWLHLSGYSLLRSPIDGAALHAAALARASGVHVSVDASSWSVVAAFGPERFRARLAELAPDVVFANEEEHALLGELPAPVRVLKLGARGCRVEHGGRTLELPAVPADPVDSTGAGDAFAAGFLLGATPEEGARRGLEAAARCVSAVGAMP